MCVCVLFAGGNESGLAKTDGDTQLGWEDFSSFLGGWRWRGFIDDKQWQQYAKMPTPNSALLNWSNIIAAHDFYGSSHPFFSDVFYIFVAKHWDAKSLPASQWNP